MAADSPRKHSHLEEILLSLSKSTSFQMHISNDVRLTCSLGFYVSYYEVTLTNLLWEMVSDVVLQKRPVGPDTE